MASELRQRGEQAARDAGEAVSGISAGQAPEEEIESFEVDEDDFPSARESGGASDAALTMTAT